jgi:Zn-dependent peptidase ImmA (M78 family)
MSICPYRKEALEAIARKVISQYDPRLLHAPSPIPVESIIEQVYGLTMEFQFIRSNGRVLGETVFETAMVPIYERGNGGGYKLIPVKAGTVIIDASLIHNRGDGRFRFTCAHELAHWVLHKEFYTQRGETAAMTSAARSSETDAAIERQADRLGCYLLMPKGAVKMAFYNTNGSAGNKTAALAELFGVSRQAMQIRLEEMRLLP